MDFLTQPIREPRGVSDVLDSRMNVVWCTVGVQQVSVQS